MIFVKRLKASVNIMFTSLFKFGCNALIIISYGFGKVKRNVFGIIIYTAEITLNKKSVGRIYF